jgi:O-antigen/teichoic acid export membrane protein
VINRTVSRVGVYWTIGAFGVVSLAGLFLNQLIATQLGAVALGRFNIFLAVLIIGGQLGTVGIHGSVLFHTPKARSNGKSTSRILVAALVAVSVSSLVTAGLVVGVGEVVFRSTGNDYYLSGLRAIAIGLFFYPLNKTLLSHVNGLRWIRTFSVLFAARFVLMAALVSGAVFVFDGGQHLLWVITATESLVFAALLLALRGEFKVFEKDSLFLGAVKSHFRFGLRGLLGGMLLDLNTRVDVLLLGVITGSRAVGVYSVGSLFAEGLYQFAMVARYSYDPVVTHLVVEQRFEELKELTTRAIKRNYYLVLPLVAIANVMYPFIVRLLFGQEYVGESWIVFALLTVGLALSAGYVPFINLLQQAGAPSRHSALLACVAGTNIVLNLILIPAYGMTGAAVATTLAQVFLVFLLRALARPVIGYQL